jgi:hypothetical protein
MLTAGDDLAGLSTSAKQQEGIQGNGPSIESVPFSSAVLRSLHGDARYRPTVVPHAPAAGLLQEHEGPAAGFGERAGADRTSPSGGQG